MNARLALGTADEFGQLPVTVAQCEKWNHPARKRHAPSKLLAVELAR